MLTIDRLLVPIKEQDGIYQEVKARFKIHLEKIVILK